VNSGAAALRRAAGAEEVEDPVAEDSGLSSCAMGIGEGKPRRPGGFRLICSQAVRPGVEGEKKKRGDGTRAVSI
jgi:hypothetical protein